MIRAARLAWTKACAYLQYGARTRLPQLRHLERFRSPIEHWLAKLPQDASFIQIGSNDGTQGDPLRDFIVNRNWTGALVEPIPFLFAKLRQNYAAQAERLQFVNAAISSARGEARLFYVAEQSKEALDLPYWYDQLGSFDRDHIIRHLGPTIEPFIREQAVHCVLFEDLVERTGLEHLDLLHIDIEGHDYEVLRQVNLARYNPTMVLFEMKHLSSADRAAAITEFVRHGYRMVFYMADALAIRIRGRAR